MKNSLRIYYDKDCGFCFQSCLFLKKFLFLKSIQLLPIDSDKNTYAIFLQDYTWVVYEEKSQKYFTKSMAFWRLVYASPFSFFYYISYIPYVIWLGDKIYDVVARNRSTTCEL